jgi:excisionase family DNA binding protein
MSFLLCPPPLAPASTGASPAKKLFGSHDQEGGIAVVSEPYLTTDEAAAMLHISRWQLFTLIKSRELPSFKPGRRRLIPLAAIEAYADRRMEDAV